MRFLRMTDPVICITGCAFTPICPPGVITNGSFTTTIEGLPVARVGDSSSNCCGACCSCPNAIITGSPKTFVDSRPVAYDGSIISLGVPFSTNLITFINA